MNDIYNNVYKNEFVPSLSWQMTREEEEESGAFCSTWSMLDPSLSWQTIIVFIRNGAGMKKGVLLFAFPRTA